MRYLIRYWGSSQPVHDTWRDGSPEVLGTDQFGLFMRTALKGTREGGSLEIVIGAGHIGLADTRSAIVVTQLVSIS